MKIYSQESQVKMVTAFTSVKPQPLLSIIVILKPHYSIFGWFSEFFVYFTLRLAIQSPVDSFTGAIVNENNNCILL